MDDKAGPGTGLRNLRDHVRGFVGPAAELALHDQVPHGVRAVIAFRPSAEGSS